MSTARRVAPSTVGDLLELGTADVLLGWTPDERPWLADENVRGVTTMAGYCLADAVRAGRIRYLPIRLSAVPSLVRRSDPEVAVVTGVRRGRDLAFLGTVGWGPAAALAARAVVVEVDEDAPDLGAPLIPGSIAAVVARGPGDDPRPRAPDAVDRVIGRQVAARLPRRHDDPARAGRDRRGDRRRGGPARPDLVGPGHRRDGRARRVATCSSAR